MDKIEQTILLPQPIGEVWQVVSDHRRFGEWFRVALDQPFVAGERSTGHITHPGYEHLRWTAQVEAVDPPSRLVFHWHPYAVDPDRDYSGEPTTRVEFRLEPEGGGTRLTVTESGFDALPDSRRDEAYRMNSGGWAAQADNLRDYLAR